MEFLPLTTALPNGANGYEHFVKKGSCRKCGVVAYGKRKCERCSRKFCSTCAPNALQKYGPEQWEECCIGCEPCLVVASEPILELEPESEDVALYTMVNGISNNANNCPIITKRGGVAPIHVPLSATASIENEEGYCYNHKNNNKSITLQIPGIDDSITYVTETETVLDDSSSCATFLSLGFAQLRLTHSRSRSRDDDDDGETTSHQEERHPQSLVLPEQQPTPQPPKPVTPTTPPRSTRSVTFDFSTPPRASHSADHHFSSSSSLFQLEPPVTPDVGCCTACQSYATGKRPCYNCGTKYCHEAPCQAFLYEDGTCAKCRPFPRPVKKQHAAEAGCCTVCQQFAMGKRPCETCGAKFCREVSCQAYLYSNGTCVVCHGEEEGNI